MLCGSGALVTLESIDMIENGLVSVIIPVYNPGKHFKKCIESIINQTYTNMEIILIDDGSTDGSNLICDKYANKDSRIICIHQENSGVSNARNKGIELAKGDYYHFPDSDDYLELDTYEYLIKLMSEHKCDAVAFEHFITYPNNEIVHKNEDSHYGLFNSVDTQVMLVNGCQFCCNKLYKASLIGKIRFRDDILRGEDTLFAAQVLKNADGVWFDERPLYHYVQSEESACRGVFRPSQFTVLMLYDAYNDLYIGEYRKVWPYFLLFMQNVLISLYYDVWSDINHNKYKKQKKVFYNSICRYSNEIKSAGIMSKKQIVKFRLFKLSPNVFCIIHKIIHKL